MQRLLAVLLIATPTVGLANEGALEYFEREVRPILANRCYECHDAQSGPDSANLRLDFRGGWVAGGDSGPAVDAEDPAGSLLLRAISYNDPALQMPPRSKLTEREIQTLREWVAAGAVGPEEAPISSGEVDAFDLESRRQGHWAWQPVRRPELPATADHQWSHDDLDRFVLARLEGAGLLPADSADPAVWLRRVTYDLTGLPPSVAEVEEFMASTAPDKYQQVVDRLLASQAFGEHWAQHWLDLMRFAESKGHEQDFSIPHAWRYRDYVIRAINANVPYDEFLMEHIAGDLMSPPRIDPATRTNQSIQGTGWWRLGEATHSPVDIRGEEANRIDNQIDVFGKAFLGMTIACARCHDHKFDAISSEDYYALCGYIQSSSYQEANIADPVARRHIASQLSRLNDHGGPEWFALFAALTKQRLQKFLAVATPAQVAEAAGALGVQSPCAAPTNSDVIRFTGARPSHDDWITSGFSFGDRPVSVGEVLPDPDENRPPIQIAEYAAATNHQTSLSMTGLYRTRTFEVTGKTLWYYYRGQADVFLDVDSHRTIAGPLHTDCIHKLSSEGEWKWHPHSVASYLGHRVHVDFKPTGSFSLACVCFADQQPATPALTGMLAGEGATPERIVAAFTRAVEAVEQQQATTSDAKLVNWLLENDSFLPPAEGPAAEKLASMAQEFRAARRALESRLPEPQFALALLDGSGEDEYVHLRGNHQRLAPTPTPRRLPKALGYETSSTQGSGRLEVARCLVRRDNPLTARVAVNRVWAHLMGRGIVPTVDNLGVLGQPPSHPELLDYLADEFVTSRWDTKGLIRRIVLSSTYRQAARPHASLTPETIERADPANELIHQTRVRRLPAEAIRDALLVVSGEHDPKLFGPSVQVHITDFMRHNRSPAYSGPMDGDRRRSIYIEVRRNALNHFLAGFDKPMPSTTVGMRNQSNSGAQPLMLLNDPLVHHLVGKWSSRLVAEFDDDSSAIRHAYLQALSRVPDDQETQQLAGFLSSRETAANSSESRRTAWFDLCLALVNCKEFVFLQ
ncbi:MAG: PSD1 domain-containing protein [Planctomycetales bacterium]|nr:PSD1 domain-containing protein [Planctomycetales bacterium]